MLYMNTSERLIAWAELSKFILSDLILSNQRRHTVRWFRSLQQDYLLNTPSPWITFDAIDFLRQQLTPGLRFFEYGSGGSTLFWLLFNPAGVVSVEHDPMWYSKMTRRLASSVVDYRLVLPEPRAGGEAADPADPTAYASADPAYAACAFRQYVSQIDSFPDDYFDVILIDGRARPACIMHSSRKLKRGGLLILDNAERSYYTVKTQAYLQDFQCNSIAGVGPCERVWKTNIYIHA